MKRTMMALAAALALAGPGAALAQNAPDPVKLELARKLVEVNGGQAQAEAQMKAVFAAMQKGVAANFPAKISALVGPLYEDLGRQMVALTPRLLDISVRAYAQTFTEKELRDLLAFQMSDSGQSMLRKTPQVRAQVIAQSMPLIVGLMPDMMRKAADRACEVKHCTAAERAEVESAIARVAPKS
jgi:hypothetical protein